MKIFTTIFFVGLFQSLGLAQDFTTSTNYVVLGGDRSRIEEINALRNSDEDSVVFVDLIAIKNPENVLCSIPIKWTDTFDTVFVKELMNPGLKGVATIIQVTLEYAACCYDIQTLNFIMTEKGELYPLPEIYYTLCDWPASVPAYLFPIQFGEKMQKIKYVNEHIGPEGSIDSTSVLKEYTWNGEVIQAMN